MTSLLFLTLCKEFPISFSWHVYGMHRWIGLVQRLKVSNRILELVELVNIFYIQKKPIACRQDQTKLNFISDLSKGKLYWNKLLWVAIWKRTNCFYTNVNRLVFQFFESKV